MDRAAAKELLHIDGWLDRSAQIVERGKDVYSLMTFCRRRGTR